MARSDWNDLSLEAARTTHRAAATKLRDADIKNIRNLVLSVNSAVGRLSECFSWKTENQCEDYLCGFTRSERNMVLNELGSAVALLLVIADFCHIDLPAAVQLKIQLNAQKYPAALVRGSALKYDAYKEHTGYAKGSNQVTTNGATGDNHLASHNGRPWSAYTFEELRTQLEQFAQDRGWEKFHTPRNLCLALSGEAGELCELFQFKDEDDCTNGLQSWTKDSRDQVAQELSDVCIYACRLSDVCGLNITNILQNEDVVGRSCSLRRN